MNIVRLIYKQYRKAFFIMLALTLLSGALSIGILSFINKYMMKQNPDDLDLILLSAFLLILVLYFIVSTAAQYKLTAIVQNFVFDLRTRMFKQIMDLPHEQFQKTGASKILASMSNDISTISHAFAHSPELIHGALISIACSVYIVILSPQLFMVTIGLLLLMVVVSNIIVTKVYGSYKALRKTQTNLYKHYETGIYGHRENLLNRYRGQRFYNESLLKESDLNRQASIRSNNLHILAVSWGQAVMLATVGVVFFCAAYFGWGSLSDAATISMAILFMRAPLSAAIAAYPLILRSQVAYQALEELGLSPYEEAFISEHSMPEDWKTIRFENVVYKYPEQGGTHFELEPINFTLHRDEVVMLIGHNGSGKSTLSMLLTGLYRPTSGQIYVDDIPITDDNITAYRQLFSSVFTDFHLFDDLWDSVGNDAPEDLIQTWLSHLQLSEKVKYEKAKLLNTQLSQGQKKRLGLLIAALEQRSVLVLDEWAADQDPGFRKIFYEHLLPLLQKQGYTVFAISHDDKYFANSDRVMAMKQGRLLQYSDQEQRDDKKDLFTYLAEED